MTICVRDISELKSRVDNSKPRIIGIDGASGVGKTSLCRELSDMFVESTSIHIDDVLIRNADKSDAAWYWEMVEHDWLRRLLGNPVRQRLLVDGICLRKVLNDVGIDDFLWIYVKKISSAGNWHYGYYMEEVDHGEGRVDQSTMKYHIEFQPYKQASIVYERHVGRICHDCGREVRPKEVS